MDLSNLKWQKSSFTGSNGGNCVEVSELEHPAQWPDHKRDAVLALPDSKDPHGPVLFFNDTEWAAFLNGVKAHEFDR